MSRLPCPEPTADTDQLYACAGLDYTPSADVSRKEDKIAHNLLLLTISYITVS